MKHRTASFLFKLFYCLAVFSAVAPIGLASSGWVRASSGGGLLGFAPFIGPIVFFALGLYRVFLVTRVPGTLSSQPVTGISAMLRAIGVFCIYVGAVVGILNFVWRPIMGMFITQRSETGMEFFIVGVAFALAGGIGVLGLVLFEFSRLLSFEHHAREERTQPANRGAF